MQLQDYFAAERKRFPATADIAYFMTASTGLIPDYVHEGISAYQEARYRRGGDSRWRDGEDSMAMMYRSKCQMADMLERESVEAWEERKRKARVLGEAAATKLLFPMMLMLIVVMAIVMIPAFLSFYGGA